MNKNHLINKAMHILDAAKKTAASYKNESILNQIEGIKIHSEGYADNDGVSVIATGNWNNIIAYNQETNKHDMVSDLPTRIQGMFDRLGIMTEWDDIYAICYNCAKLIKIEPDCMFWKPRFQYVDGEGFYCLKCSDILSKLKHWRFYR